MYGVTCRVTKMLDRFERRAVERLLSESGLVYEGTPDYTALAEGRRRKRDSDGEPFRLRHKNG